MNLMTRSPNLGRPQDSPQARAFSLIEILVTVGLLSFIILGLLAMFNQTQRAFRSGMTQTDVLEAGRSVTDMMVRELEQMSPSYMPWTTNFFAYVPASFSVPLLQGLPGTVDPLNGALQDKRTNVVQRFFFLSRVNTDWVGTGYQVIPESPNAGVGALYRYERTARRDGAWYLASDFLLAPITNMSLIVDGIVHLRLRAFDIHGNLIMPTNQVSQATNYWNVSPRLESEVDYSYFISNAVPAFVELEMGILEPQLLQRFRAFTGNPVSQLNFLSNNVARTHLFRQRIPIRNVDSSVYR